MKLSPLRYERPLDVSRAEELLRTSADAAPLAGGQSLIPALRLGERRLAVLVDLSALTQLRGIHKDEGGDLVIGAGEPMAGLERSPLVAQHAPLLVRVLRTVGAVGIRSRATLGGSLGWADPTSQLPAALVALDARVETTTRTLAVADLLTGPHRTALGAGELILRVLVPPAPGPGSLHLVRRTHITWPVAGAVASDHEEGPRLVVFGVAPTPILLRTSDPDTATAELLERMETFDDERASAAYRHRVAPVLARRAIDELGASA